jgi:NADPH2:quinone reductase
MRAIAIARPGGPEVLVPVERPRPEPGAGELRLRLAWAGVNRPDLYQRAGAYPPPPGASDLPGLEGAGWVEAVGPGVTGWREGDEACALLPGGGYAEAAVAPAAHCLPIPAGLSLRDAAGLPEALFTVWGNLVRRGRLAGGERLLVHGGLSGIGVAAVQLGALRGARVFATARGPERARRCEAFGAERGIDHGAEDWEAILRAEGGADVILDIVGGDYTPRNLRALAEDGRLVQVSTQAGAKVELDLRLVMARRLTVTGSTLRPQSVAAKAALARELLAEVWPLVAAGRMAMPVEAEYPLAAAAAAHARLEAGGHVGKILLRVA